MPDPVVGEDPFFGSSYRAVPFPATFDLADPTAAIVGAQQTGPGAIPVALPAPAVTGLIVGGPCRLMGWALRETAGAVARLDIFSGGNNTGLLVAPVLFAALGFSTMWFPQFGIECNGISVTVAAGAVTGVLYILPE